MPESQIKATYIHHCGNDLTVVNAARVSFGKKSEMEEDHGVWHLKPKDVSLIEYLAKHGHTSPFGHCFFTFHVKAPVFVRAQLVKHKFLRVNEISRRYVDDEPEFYQPDVWRGKAPDKKQGSLGSVEVLKNNFHEESTPADEARWANMNALNVYRDLLAGGVAPEMARMVLPQSMMTEWYWSGSLDAFADMCYLRIGKDAQHESRLVALQVSSAIFEACPVSWKALMER